MTAPDPVARSERRGIAVAAGVFFGILVVLVVIAIVASGDAGDERTTATVATSPCAEDDVACRAVRESGERPGIIPKPGEGTAPDRPGDRGGWEQLALLGVIVVAVGGIATYIIRSGRRTRAATASAASATPGPEAAATPDAPSPPEAASSPEAPSSPDGATDGRSGGDQP